MKKELNMLKQRKVWTIVPQSTDMPVITNRWVYTVKTNTKGEILKFKARLVAGGHRQISGIDYDDVFSPVVDFSLLRLFYAICISVLGWLSYPIDVKRAYLYGELTHVIYMSQSQGSEGDVNKICKLNKSIYGLHQSGKEWHAKLRKTLLERGFTLFKSANCVFGYEDKAMLLIYVDDIAIFAAKFYLDVVISTLESCFEIKKIGPISKLLGVQFVNEGGVIGLHQKQYIEELKQLFPSISKVPLSLPASPHGMPRPDIQTTEDKAGSNYPYRNLLGCLQYISNRSRPDISYSVNYYA